MKRINQAELIENQTHHEASAFLNAKNSKVVICGTARNVAEHVEDSVKSLMDAFFGFSELRIVICESFSTDRTLDSLEKLRKKYPQLTYFSDGIISKTENRRTVRIASARNELLRYVDKNYKEFDFVAMVDLDGVNRDLTSKNIHSIFRYKSWDAAFANQPLRYYDIWALRAKGWCEGDCWKEYQELLQIFPKREAKRIAVTSKMKSIPRNAQPIPVESAFGGLAIYRTEAFLDGEYIGEDVEGNEICEHVYFHKILLEKGHRLFIMPTLVNLNRRTQVLNIIKELLLRATRRIK